MITVYDHEEYGPTVVGRKQGKGKARILMFAHMDTVWPEGTCAQRPLHVEGKFAYGPGVSDCVHGMIGALYSLQALNDTGFEDYGEIIILFNPDEELYSPSSKQWIEKYARISDVAFCMEGPDFGISISPVRRCDLLRHRGGGREVPRWCQSQSRA